MSTVNNNHSRSNGDLDKVKFLKRERVRVRRVRRDKLLTKWLMNFLLVLMQEIGRYNYNPIRFTTMNTNEDKRSIFVKDGLLRI